MDIRNDWDNRNHDDRDNPGQGEIDGIEALADALLPDPWDDPHDIEYWVWNGEHLAPATSGEQANIQEVERTQSARRRLALWERQQRVAPWKQFVAGAAGFVGIRRLIAAARTVQRHNAQPIASPLDTHHTATSAHQHDSER